MAIYSGFSHKKWWFSIVMLVYQRVDDLDMYIFWCFLRVTSRCMILEIRICYDLLLLTQNATATELDWLWVGYQASDV